MLDQTFELLFIKTASDTYSNNLMLTLLFLLVFLSTSVQGLATFLMQCANFQILLNINSFACQTIFGVT